MKGRETMATFTLDDWDYDDTSPDKYILNGWTGSTTEKEIYIPGEYNGRQISLKDLKIFPSSMTHLQLEEVNGKKVQLETVDLLDSFKENRTVINLDLSGLDTSRVTNMSAMFSWCSYLKSLNVNGWNTENVQSMFEIFNYCSSLSNLDVSGFQTENVTKMGSMFSRCIQLKIIDFSQCHWVSVPNNVFNFSSTAPLV